MLCVHLAEARGDKQILILPYDLFRRVAKHPLGSGIKENDLVVLINADDSVHGRVKDARDSGLALPERFFHVFTLGDVASNA